MIPFIRRQKIIEMLHNKDIAYLDEVVKETNSSVATTRRDLKTLQEEGLVELLSGGAVKIKTHLGEEPLNKRVNTNRNEKEMIGKYAATFVNDGDFIFIGPGTTENALIEYLRGKSIKVVTNGTYHIKALIDNNIESIILGGKIINEIAVVAGPFAIEQIENMHFDKCFIGCTGISYEGDISVSDENVAFINKVAINNSSTSYFIADSTKIGKQSRYKFYTMHKEDHLITTTIPKEFLGECELLSIK